MDFQVLMGVFDRQTSKFMGNKNFLRQTFKVNRTGNQMGVLKRYFSYRGSIKAIPRRNKK